MAGDMVRRHRLWFRRKEGKRERRKEGWEEVTPRALTLLLLLLTATIAASAWAAPYAQGGSVYVYQYQASPPSWYVSAASNGTLYTYAYPSSLSVTVRRFTQLYSFNTSNVWLSIANGQVYSGASYDGDNYEYRLTLTQSYSSSGTYTYTWSGNLFSFTASASGTVSLNAKIAASSACVYNVTLVLYRDDEQVGRLTTATTGCPISRSAGWGQVSFSVSGGHTLSAYVYVIHNIAAPSSQSLTVTVEVDRIAVSGAYIVNTADLSATASPTGAQQSGLQVRAVYTLTLTGDVDSVQVVSVSPSPVSYSASYSKPTLTVTAYYNAQAQALSSGTVALPKPSRHGVLQYIARAPQGYLIVTNSTQEYLDEAYAPGSAVALQVSFVELRWKAVYALAQRYVLSVLNASTASIGSVTLPAGKYLVIASKADPADKCYLKLNSTLLYSAALLNNTVLAPPQSGVTAVTFTVQDFGAGYNLLQASDLQGNIAGSGLIGATGQVALNLTPYASYMIQVCKQGLCKSVGLVTISSMNIQLTVMPTVPAVKPPSWVGAGYDYANKALRVNVSCTSPPCTVRIFKSVVWYNSWQMRIPVSLSQGWNLVFLRKSSTVSASGMWAHINASSWSEVRFGDSSGLPEKFLPYSIIWSNSTHAQVLVYAPQPGTYYLYWQSQVQVPAVSVSHPFYACHNNICGVRFNGINQYAQTWASRNWFSSGAQTLSFAGYVFENYTIYDMWILLQGQVLQGQMVPDSSNVHHPSSTLYVPASVTGYVWQANLTGIGGGGNVVIYCRAGAPTSQRLFRVEVWEGATLVDSFDVTPGTSYSWYGGSIFMWLPQKTYTIKVYSYGGTDGYIGEIFPHTHIPFIAYYYRTFAWRWSSNSARIVYETHTSSGGIDYWLSSAGIQTGRFFLLTMTLNSTHKAIYLNSSLADSKSYTGGLYPVVLPIIIGANPFYFYGLISSIFIYDASLSANQVSQLYSTLSPPTTSGLLIFLKADPRYLYDINWDGWVDWIDLSGNGNHLRLVNFHSRGSFANAPQRQPLNMLVIEQTCNAQLCGYALSAEDPYFTVVVSDANGRTAQASTGLSVPLWQSPLGVVVNTVGNALNLDAFGVNVNDLIIVLVGLGVIYAAFTFLTWEYAILFFGVWLSIGTLLLGGSGRLVPPGLGLIVFGAVLSLLLKKEKEV
jgi:hypothetical protein